jgi:hypothetical protein
LDVGVQEAIIDLLEVLAEQADHTTAGIAASSVKAGVTAHFILLAGDADFIGALYEHTDHATQTIHVLRLIALPG